MAILSKAKLLEETQVKNTHLTHIEDLVFKNGSKGVEDANAFLRSLVDMLSGHGSSSLQLTVKWDGSPSIVAGINPENGRFFVGTKSALSTTAKLNYTYADIDMHYPDTDDRRNAILKVCLDYLPELHIENIIQGDLLFVQNSISHENIHGAQYITFRPNVITYAVPAESSLADQMLRAKLGIVWHTQYRGDYMSELRTINSVDISRLTPTKNVWFRDADFLDLTGSATFKSDETDAIRKDLYNLTLLRNAVSPYFLDRIAANRTLSDMIAIYNNSLIRSGEGITSPAHVASNLIRFVDNKLVQRQTEAKQETTRLRRAKDRTELVSFLSLNINELISIYSVYAQIVKIKLKILGKIRNIEGFATFIKTDTGYKVTAPEGFVAVDTLNSNIVKLVDRMEFSRENFNLARNW